MEVLIMLSLQIIMKVYTRNVSYRLSVAVDLINVISVNTKCIGENPINEIKRNVYKYEINLLL